MFRDGLEMKVFESEVKSMDPFTKYNALLYALIGAQDDSYLTQARYLCATVDALTPDHQKRGIVDVGCGYGISTLAILEHFRDAAVVWSQDKSADMVRVAQIMQSGDSRLLPDLCEEPEFTRVVGQKRSDQLRTHLRQLQCRFKALGLQQHPTPYIADITIGPINQPCGVILANNVLHWPLQELMSRGATKFEALSNIFFNLASDKPNFTLGFLLPADFVDWDEPLTQHNALLKHPQFIAMSECVNKYLLENHGIVRAIPTANPLFSLVMIQEVVRSVFQGARVQVRMVHRTRVDYPHTSVTQALWCRLPMQLAKLTALSADEKLAVMSHVTNTFFFDSGIDPLCNTDFVFVISVNR